MIPAFNNSCNSVVEVDVNCLPYFFFSKLTLSVPKKMKNSIFAIPIIPNILNISNLGVKAAVKILSSWISLGSLSNTILKIFLTKQCLPSPFSRYRCLKVSRYYDLHSEPQGAQELKSLPVHLARSKDQLSQVTL